MHDIIWILIIFILIYGFLVYIYRQKKMTVPSSNPNSNPNSNAVVDKGEGIANKIQKLQQQNIYLEKVKTADENIFDYIRCINIPRTPLCKGVENDTSNICRSKQIDCNKFKLVLENDPIAVERMKIATNQYVQSNKPQNPSDLTFPVKSGWMF